ncbi:MAG: Flp pilus assembly protein CpaB [Dehalococcoidia bacterium]
MARTLTAGGPDRANRMIFFGAVGLALLAALLVFAALANFGGDGGTASIGDTLEVVVASQDISPGDEITGDMVELASLPVSVLVDDAFTETSLVVGTTANARLLRGDQLAPSKVQGLGDEEADGVAFIIPDGMRAVAVSVTEETAGGGNILPGDHVDVVVVAATTVDGVDITRGVLLLQDIEVLAVAQETLRPVTRVDVAGEPLETEDSEGTLSSRDGAEEDPDAATVTLSVFPEDAPLLAVAQEEGAVYLVLRAIGDGGTVDGVERVLP